MRTVAASDVLGKIWALYRSQDIDQIQVDDFRVLRRMLDMSLEEIWRNDWYPAVSANAKRRFAKLFSASDANLAGTYVFYPPTGQYYQAIRDAGAQVPATLSGGNYATNLAYWAEAKQTFDGAATYASTTSYVAGDQVQFADDGKFYQCHTACSGVDPDQTSNWGELIGFERKIEYAPDWDSEFRCELIYEVTDHDAINGRSWERVPFVYGRDGVHVTDEHFSEVWVQYRVVRPNVSGDPIDLSQSYAVGASIYFVNSGVGNWYTANQSAAAGETPSTDADKWDMAELPADFEPYLIGATTAKLYQAEGKTATAFAQLQYAASALGIPVDEIARQAGITRPQRTR